MRFDFTYQALAPELKIIAPWREWTLKSREDCLDYAEQHGIAVNARRFGKDPQPGSQPVAHQSRRRRTGRRWKRAFGDDVADNSIAAGSA